LIPHTPNMLTDLFDQLRTAIVTGAEVAKQSGNGSLPAANVPPR